MRLAHVIQLLAAGSLILVPVVCVAGLVPHCPADHHVDRNHQDPGHHPSPHSSCLENADAQVKKISLTERDTGSNLLGAAIAPIRETIPDQRHGFEPDLTASLLFLDGSFPLRN